MHYLEHHPFAIQDVELAHEMAIAGDAHETEAARLRQHGAWQLQEAIVKDPGGVRTMASIALNVLVPKINRERFAADQKYAELEMKPHDFATEAFAALKATKR